MLCHSLVTTLCLLAPLAVAQAPNPTSSYYYPGVPTDRPYPGDYSGYLRPQVHYTPPKYFMNDPNGMHVGPDGVWHIYYQYNPIAPVAGQVHWGHATSRDLYTWTNQKIAIWPPNDYTYAFSGSAIVDTNNTSGFFPDQDNGVIAIYTLAEYPGGVPGVQYQAISYSYDGGYTFEAWEGNPVLNINSTQFRDPYVIWHYPTEKWVMVISYASDYVIGIFTSDDLKSWEHASNFTRHGLLGVQYECPNLREMPMEGAGTTWFLQISINPGAPYGGSIAQYFVGDFNGTHFTPFDEAARISNFGKDAYAGQFFNGVPGDQPQIVMDWASNWQYTNDVPTGDPSQGEFRSAMSIPRAVTVRNASAQAWNQISKPYNIWTVFDSVLASNDSLGNGSVLVDFRDVASTALYFEVNVTGATVDTLIGMINFTVSSSVSGEYLSGGTNLGNPGVIWEDRGHTYGFENPFFTDKFSDAGPFNPPTYDSWSMAVVLDRAIFELFLNDGYASATNTFFPNSPMDTLRIDVGGVDPSVTASVGVWALRSTWAAQENANGTVVGNVTSSAPGNYSRLMF